jgi:hypothetical protein
MRKAEGISQRSRAFRRMNVDIESRILSRAMTLVGTPDGMKVDSLLSKEGLQILQSGLDSRFIQLSAGPHSSGLGRLATSNRTLYTSSDSSTYKAGLEWLSPCE